MEKHIIRSITLDTTIADEDFVEGWRNTLRRIDFESVLGKALSSFDFKKEWMCINRLEINLGEMSWENEEEWKYKISIALEEQLSYKMNFYNTMIGPYKSLLSINREEESVGSIIDSDHYLLQILINYLQTGTPPWQLIRTEDAGEGLTRLILKNPSLVREPLRGLLRNSPSAVDRLMMLLDFNQLLCVIKLFIGKEVVDDLILLYTVLQKHFPNAKTKQMKQKMLRKFILLSASDDMHTENLVKKLCFSEIRALGTTREWEKVQAFIHGHFEYNEEFKRIIVSTVNKMAAVSGRENDMEVSEKGIPITSEMEERTNSREIRHQSEKRKEKVESHDEVIFIHNSGLVLLNSGLIKYYLQRLGWVENNEFMNELARKKAILWLHYLTHGPEKIREYELSLIKLLCGLLPTDIVDVKIRLTGKERKKAEEMIETVIDGWTALKKVSHEGFRQSFLQREGRLVQDEAGWQLHVQSKAYDILIDQIPWSYSIIKFPWMLKPLFTQWSTRI